MDNDDKLLDLLLRWEEVAEQGQPVSAEDLCRDCPELVGPLREKIQALGKTAWMSRPIGDEPESSATSSTNPSTRILADRYRLEELLGEGGFGQVWRAYDLELQRPVAVKVPKPSRRFSAEELDRFLAEARQVAGLRHPGIVAVHDVCKVEGAYVIVADLIDGHDLGERLRQGRLAPGEAARIVAEVARSLDYAHGQKIVHRDIKPANILLDGQGNPLVCDFGAATEHLVAAPGDWVGTLPYCSPEQVRGQPLDARSDVWSVGVVLYEALTGQLPFDADNPAALRNKILNEAPRPPRAIDRSIPKALERVCLNCLAKRPDDRCPTASALADDLDTFLRRGGRARPVFWTGAVLLLLAGVAGVLGMWGQRQPPGTTAESVGALEPGQIRRFEGHPGECRCVAYSPDGRFVLAGYNDTVARLYDVESGKVVRPFHGHSTWVLSVAFSSDGRWALSSSGGVVKEGQLVIGDDQSVRLWDVTSGKEVRRYVGRKTPVGTAVFSPDDRQILAGYDDGTITLWDVATAKVVRHLHGHSAHVMRVAFSPDGRRAVSGSADSTVRLWDVETGQEVHRFDGHVGIVWGVAFSPGGDWLLSAGADHSIRLWDVEGRRERRRLEGHTDQVMSVAVSADGKRALSGSMDRTIRLWDVSSGEELARFEGHTHEVKSVAFSPDGLRAVSGGLDCTVRLWRLP